MFGTDGIRGKVGKFPVDCDTFFNLGIAISKVFKGGISNIVLVARDTRISSLKLESALIAGLTSKGMFVMSLGLLPTSALGFLVPKLNASSGIMISASHNKYHDNGLKFFAQDGKKVSRSYERLIEEALGEQLFNTNKINHKFLLEKNSEDIYLEKLIGTAPFIKDYSNLKIVIDSANGAAFDLAPKLFRRLGAQVFSYNDTPNGININEGCGSMHPENICDAIIRHGADIGICLDGDADRLVLCDEYGSVVDGDQLIASLALFFSKIGVLNNNKIVGTVISSKALEDFLQNKGLKLIRTDVGERSVVEKMQEVGSDFGAENSGHFVIKKHANTSDALIAAIQVVSIMVEEGLPLSKIMNHFPMPIKFAKNIYLKKEVDSAVFVELSKQASGAQDIILIIRKSGTEQGLIRVYAEGDSLKTLSKAVELIEEKLRAL